MKKTWIMAATVGVAAIAVWLVTRAPREAPQPLAAGAQQSVGPEQRAAAPADASPTMREETRPELAQRGQEPEAPTEESKEVFQTDAAGKLVLEEQTRLKLEAFFAHTPSQDVGTAALALVQQLPPAAAAQALDVVEHYGNYQAAQDAAYTDDAPASPEDAIVQLETLHRLRVEHFGPELAKVFYGDEERLARELIELMRLEKDQSLTMEEKAERAQRLRDTLPAVSAADRGEPPPKRE
jgi:hypothetical protein